MQNKIRMIREKRGLSQAQLACAAGVASSLTSEFELGKRYVWPKATVALAQALSVSGSDLFSGELHWRN